jgi:hypothetical protein
MENLNNIIKNIIKDELKDIIKDIVKKELSNIINTNQNVNDIFLRADEDYNENNYKEDTNYGDLNVCKDKKDKLKYNKEYFKNYYHNKPGYKEKVKEYYQKNKEKIKARAALRYKSSNEDLDK